MALEPSKDNVTGIGRKAARETGKAVDEAAAVTDAQIDAAMEDVLPERRYSFHALVAVGLAGFVLGRIFGR